MSDAEVMTAALVVARYFGQQKTRKRVEVSISFIEQLFPKSIHAVSAAGFELKVLLFVIATSIKQLFGQR